ncbi:MAG: GNAT family N-acetyltransferase [Christensenella sp.]|nr:GNAT family N-acetyltransferase [Christensenella sp.]
MITNEWFCGLENAPDAAKIRTEVFVNEQRFKKEDEFDVYDNQSMHVVIYDGEKPIGTGRLYHDGRTFCIGRICVLKEERSMGVGDLLMRLLLVKAFSYRPSQVRIMAQMAAKGFYENFGFAVCGDEEDECGVAHVPMCVTPDTLVFKSGCGKEMRFADLFPEQAETPPEQ